MTTERYCCSKHCVAYYHVPLMIQSLMLRLFFLPLLITVIRPSTYFTLFPWLIFILCLWIHDIPVNRNIQRIESKRILE